MTCPKDGKKMQYGIEKAGNGSLTAFLEEDGKKRYIHSRFVPEREADLFSDISNAEGILIIFGLALGYHLSGKEFLNDTCSDIIIVDPCEKPENLFDRNDIRWLRSDKVILLHNFSEESAAKKIADLAVERMESIIVVKHVPSVKAFPDYFRNLERLINRDISCLVSAQKTKNMFSSIFFRNGCLRLPSLENEKTVSDLENRFTDYDAVIVSSGPSLDRYIDEIRLFQDRFFIIAVDSALPVLRDNGVRADISVTIDPQIWVSEHTAGTETVSINSFSSFFHRTGNKCSLLAFNSHPLSQICALLSESRIMDTTGCVAGDALYYALFMGFKKCWLTGADFSFPGNRIYSSGTVYYSRFLSCTDRFSTIASKEMSYIRRGKRVLINGVKSRNSFLDFKNSIEKMLSGFKTETVHLTGGGALLQGAHAGKSGDLTACYKSCDALSGKIITEKRKILERILSETPSLKKKEYSREKLVSILLNSDIRSQLFAESFGRSEKKKEKYSLILDYFLECCVRE